MALPQAQHRQRLGADRIQPRVAGQPEHAGRGLLKHPTTLQFGPDGKLYVGQQDGYIHVLTLDANRNVTAVQRINTILNTPNINPDGSPAPTVMGRHLIGIDFDPASTPDQPDPVDGAQRPALLLQQDARDLQGQHRLGHPDPAGRARTSTTRPTARTS